MRLLPSTRSAALRILALLAIAAGAASCDGDAILGIQTGTPGSVGGGGGGSSNLAPELVGRWRHTEIFNTPNSIQSSQTVWEFRSDGIAVRTITVVDLTTGVGDVITSTGSWSTNGLVVTISFFPPDFGSVSFDFRIVGGVLTLGGIPFQRT
ncbi:MAG TPA: hypothetical protein VFK13_09520 [Gemmatimonadaceae bacterium]|nr:hypothetical protein [Gemmatimonadaceae bacterium]